MWKCKLFLAGQSWPIFGFHLTSPPSIEKLIHFSLFWSEKRNLCIKNKNKLATKFSLSAIDWFNCRNFFHQKIKRLFCKHFFGEKNDTANCELSALITSPLRGSWLEQKKSFCSSEHFFLSLSKSSSAAAASIIQIVLLRGSLREETDYQKTRSLHLFMTKWPELNSRWTSHPDGCLKLWIDKFSPKKDLMQVREDFSGRVYKHFMNELWIGQTC